MKTMKSQALERIIELMNESFDAEDIMKLAIAYSVVKHGVSGGLGRRGTRWFAYDVD